MLQAPSVISEKITVQYAARSLEIEVRPEKHDRYRFHLYLSRMWLGTVIYFADCDLWGCATSDEICSESNLEVVAVKMMDAYFAMASISNPGFKDRFLAA